MARKKTATLTDGELRLITIIWDLGEATVGDVVDKLPADLDLAYNTVLTTMRILEQKGYLQRVKSGRAHIYRPIVTRGQARRKAVRHMLSNLFDGSPEALLVSILEDEKLSAADVERLKKMIDEKR